MKTYIVYEHINATNGKRYIGITSQAPERRWKNGKGYSNMHFGRAISKYGWDNFIHKIIASNLQQETACAIEKSLIDLYKTTNKKFGYNEAKGGEGGGMYNKRHSEKAKEKIRQARKRNGFTEEHKKHISEAKKGIKHHCAKKVYQYTKNGNFVRCWDYMSLAAKELNINKANIGQTCNGKRKSAGGFIWRYERV